MRAVCRLWRDALSDPGLLGFLHSVAPRQPLLCFDRAACPHDYYIHLRDYCVESLALRSRDLRPVLRFADNEFEHHDSSLNDGPEQEHVYASMTLSPPQLQVHAFLGGHLVVSFKSGWFVVNPATRHWAALPDLTGYDVGGFYEHAPSGEYRLLCVSGKGIVEATTWYHVLTGGGSVKPRLLGRPILPEDQGLEFGVDNACVSPPVQVRRSLHWSPQWRQGYDILVFDTEAELFSWMSPPVRDQAMRLLQLPARAGKLGLSVSMRNKATVELWSLEDYRNQIWVLMYRIQLAVDEVPLLYYGWSWTPAAVSQEGDVLIECCTWLLHFDRNGDFLRQFCFLEGILPVRHALQENLRWHPMYHHDPEVGGTPPPFFHWLSSDPSW